MVFKHSTDIEVITHSRARKREKKAAAKAFEQNFGPKTSQIERIPSSINYMLLHENINAHTHILLEHIIIKVIY